MPGLLWQGPGELSGISGLGNLTQMVIRKFFFRSLELLLISFKTFPQLKLPEANILNIDMPRGNSGKLNPSHCHQKQIHAGKV